MNSSRHRNKGISLGIMCASVLLIIVVSARADIFGNGTNTFVIDLVTISNPGNPNDTGVGGGSYFSDYGGVGYSYRLGVYEISQDQIDIAKLAAPLELANVTAGAHTGAEPAANIQWYQAAAFVNWLNTSTGHQAAYNLSFSGSWGMALWSSSDAWQPDGENLYRHKNAFYFLPSEDEWYKAAYHQNDGVTADYWDFATGSNSVPTQEVAGGTTAGSAVYDGSEPGSPGAPVDVNLAGGLGPYGTMGQNGNVREWNESAFDGSNNSSSELRVSRGGYWSNTEGDLRSSYRAFGEAPEGDSSRLGFRVASVPEPSVTIALLLGGGALLSLRRCRIAACG